MIGTSRRGEREDAMNDLRFLRGRVRRFVLAAVVAGTVALGGVPAGATVIEQQHYSFTESFSYSDCGFLVNGISTVTGTLHIRVGKGDKATGFFEHDNFSFREVHTNPANGKWFVVRGNGLFQETKGVHVGGSIFEFTSIIAGQPFVIEDSAGRVLLRDRGVIRRTILFDTEGDNIPGGIELAELDFSISGPHPGFSVDFCAIATRLIGP
jgi:hypothetical protein